MKKKCRHSQVLDLTSMIGGNWDSNRYYCNNPKSLNHYCEVNGLKEQCPRILKGYKRKEKEILRVLIVDKSLHHGIQIQSLIDIRYSITLAQDLYELNSQLSEQNKPDIILVCHPGMEDIDHSICDLITKKTGQWNIPVILIFEKGHSELESAYCAGTVDVLLEPVSSMLLNTKIKIHLSPYIENRNLRKELDLKQKMIRDAADLQKKLVRIEERDNSFFSLDVFHRQKYRLGGDFVDIVKMRGDRTGIILADVSGHGIKASMVSSLLKSHALNLNRTESLSHCLYRLNNELFCMTDDLFVSVLAGILDPQDKSFTYINCGLCPPVSINRESVIEYSVKGTALGAFSNIHLPKEQKILLDDQSRLYLFTDGMIDGGPGQERELKKPFLKILKEKSEISLSTAVKETGRHFSKGEYEIHDDMTLVGIGLP